MNPTVAAAVIAASASTLTLIGTLAAQYLGRRATSKDTQRAFQEQSEHLDRTLTEQWTRAFNERFTTAADQLGSDKPAVRLAGVYAMAGLADDWEAKRQTCVDVLCAYLRMPNETDPGQNAPEPRRLAFQANREVRHTVIRVIAAHLQKDTPSAKSWQRLNFDFTGVVFDGGDFMGTQFSGGTVFFTEAKFSGGDVLFNRAEFSGGKIYFNLIQVLDGMLSFSNAQFSGGEIYFNAAEFSSLMVSFIKARFTGSEIYFGAVFSGGLNSFSEAQFSGGEVEFGLSEFSGGEVSFRGAEFSGGSVSFSGAKFSGSRVDFSPAVSDDTGELVETRFSGGEVDFSDVGDWSFPPAFPWTDLPPSGVKLPKKANQSQA
jgi:uncharacterized protein YjbI with pentapeptide repeats